MHSIYYKCPIFQDKIRSACHQANGNEIFFLHKIKVPRPTHKPIHQMHTQFKSFALFILIFRFFPRTFFAFSPMWWTNFLGHYFRFRNYTYFFPLFQYWTACDHFECNQKPKVKLLSQCISLNKCVYRQPPTADTQYLLLLLSQRDQKDQPRVYLIKILHLHCCTYTFDRNLIIILFIDSSSVFQFWLSHTDKLHAHTHSMSFWQ